MQRILSQAEGSEDYAASECEIEGCGCAVAKEREV